MKVDVCMKCRQFKHYDEATGAQWCPQCDYDWRKQRAQPVPGETTVWAKIWFCAMLFIMMVVGYVFWTVLP